MVETIKKPINSFVVITMCFENDVLIDNSSKCTKNSWSKRRK